MSPWNHRYKQGPFSVTWHRNEKLIEEEGHVTDLIAAEATKWIESRGDAPFFLYVPFTAVHLPLKEPAEWVARVPAGITGDVARHYAASVMHLDDAVGRIVAALEKKGRRENTIVVFTSDNGGSTAENNDLKYPDDNCPNGKLTGNNQPLRGQKGSVYEGGTRVPTLLSWPAKLKPGTLQRRRANHRLDAHALRARRSDPGAGFEMGRHQSLAAAQRRGAGEAARDLHHRPRLQRPRRARWRLETHRRPQRRGEEGRSTCRPKPPSSTTSRPTRTKPPTSPRRCRRKSPRCAPEWMSFPKPTGTPW